jgi:DNA-binding transcriptional ArsR family regulator
MRLLLNYSRYFAFVAMALPTIEIDFAPAYELILSLATAGDVAGVDTYEDPPSAPPELVREVQAFGGGSDMVWAHLLGLTYRCPSPRDVPALLACLEATDPHEIKLVLLGYHVRWVRRTTPPEVIEAAARGDRAARQEFLRTAAPDEAWRTAIATLLPRDAAEVKSRLIALIGRWNEATFREQEPQLLTILRRDAEAKEALPAERLLEAALPGYDYVPEPGVRHIVLIPSYVIRPEIHSFEQGETRFFAYSVADESLNVDGDAPSPQLVRLARALGDERRLRILRRLTTGDYTLQELADHFGAGNTTVLHHLIILRGAGLVRLRAQGTSKPYVLRRETVARLGALLEDFLGEEA